MLRVQMGGTAVDVTVKRTNDIFFACESLLRIIFIGRRDPAFFRDRQALLKKIVNTSVIR